MVFRLFNRIYANFFWDFEQNFIGWSFRTALYVSKGLFPWEASSLKRNIFQILCRILDGVFPVFRRQICSTVVKTALDSLFLIGFMFFFGLHAKFYRLVCRNCTLCVHRIVFVFTGSIFSEKKSFQIIFRILDGDFSGFRQKISSMVFRTALVSRFFNRIYANFFGTSRKISLPGLSELYSTCPQDCFCFHRKHLLWKIKSFQIIFRILDGDFSGFRQKISSTVIKTALDSRFLIGYMPTFFGVYAKFYWLVCQNTTLRAHRIVFMGRIFFEKNTLPIVFLILRGSFSGFWANLFQRGSRNCIGF